VNTYYDPVSNTSINYGVQAYLRYGNSSAFFARFGVPITPYVATQGTTINVNIANGSLLPTYEPPALQELIVAAAIWENITAKYANLFNPGFWDFPAPDQIPAELLQPFGKTATDYGIQALIPTMATISNVGVGGIVDVLTMYVIIAFGYEVTSEFLASELFVPKGHSNSFLYQQAYRLLQQDTLLSSWPVYAERDASGVKMVVQSADGCRKLIKAKKLLVTIPPSVARLDWMDLDTREIDVFSTWTPTWSFAGVARIPSIPANYTVQFYAPAAAPNHQLDIRNWPYTLSIAATGPPGESLFRVLIASNESTTHAEAKGIVDVSVRNLTAKVFANATTSGVDWLAFVDHNSVLWRQTPAQLRAGFVQKLYALQGPRSTWYTGGLWSADYTGDVWAFTETVLPKLVASLE